MEENGKLVNALIKRKKLIELLKNVGIKRIGSGSLELMEEKIGEYFLNFCLRLKEEMEVNGKKVLGVKEIERVVEDLKKEEEIDY